MASVATAMQPRPTPHYKDITISEIKFTKGLLLDQICLNLMLA
jgi:hypothetical protein